MSAIATVSPSHRAGGPGWCSTRDMEKSREIAIENRAESTLVIFPIALSLAAQPHSHLLEKNRQTQVDPFLPFVKVCFTATQSMQTSEYNGCRTSQGGPRT